MSVYLDYAATTPLRSEVLAAMLPHMQRVGGNPSAMYRSAREEREALESARRTVAQLIGAAPTEIYFTSGGTEGSNWVLQGMSRPGGLVTTKAEHHAVLDVARHLEKQGVPVTYAGVGHDGIPDAGEIAHALDKCRPSLLSVMWVNNEVGAVSPVAELAEIAAARGVPVHTDGVAAVGKLATDVRSLGVTFLSASAHKFGGPRGAGFLYARERSGLGNMLFGGRQERGMRPGTEDVAAAVGVAEALRLADAAREDEAARMQELRAGLVAWLRNIPGLRINSTDSGIPSLVSVCLPGIRSEAALVFLDSRGIECGAGAACSMGAQKASHVLAAMGIPAAEAACALRVSMGRETTPEDLGALRAALADLFARHRSRKGT